MATSSETPLSKNKWHNHPFSTSRQNQNLILDLNPAKYDGFLQPLIECLRYSPLFIALKKSKIIPLVHLSIAYSTASYQEGEEMITYKIFKMKTHISKLRFCSLLGIHQGHDLVDPETISNSAILGMFYQMGCKEVLTVVLKFMKLNLPPMWNGLFTVIFKSFSKRVTSSDYASKLFMTIMYGIFSGINLD
ncbi:unnamed protein product [Lactuca saligna]|uniref:Uncharacterized protein n=1 Tax=Lactuca saligna TaxID=75948 RepID=A0AA36EKD3_LACSI|nr:unnamed protein product [Lactuca saligna]